MIFTPLSLSGAFRITPERRGDQRGFFARMFCAEDFAARGLQTRFAQMNMSCTMAAGALRGLHFQRPPDAEVKIVRCTSGAVFDVIVDLRKGSPSFGRWQGVELSADTAEMLYVPKGFAHGFQTLTPEVEMFYMHDLPYAPDSEGGLNHADPTLAIDWPLPVAEISQRDLELPNLEELEPLDT